MTNKETTLMAGETILNSLQSQTFAAGSIEYRRGITDWLDRAIGDLHKGNGRAAGATGATANCGSRARFATTISRLVSALALAPRFNMATTAISAILATARFLSV
ncbi:hypothetical protein [Paraburkholderia tropica]|uniref:hypothetical protein n=1 Tax=Paraburkholderia tropica TaxID=92647 RepID=UPI0007ED686F|nr:hypothetical protein [Paraburkholderia tropica]OBR46179.1 hypothetical protein A6456_37635 [Paraburkholderia tropica]